ncbi:MAG: hypothetical protein MAG458_01543 [Nitrosopumilus sp.]|nr:hypothetical protein [Nitrosopumilus sp.]
MAKKILPAISLGLITIFALVFLTGGATDDHKEFRQTFQIDATYYPTGNVEITFLDKSGKTTGVVMEILGMDDSFQKSYVGSEFIELVPFSQTPKYGWEIHPIVLEIDHLDFGHVQLKTEIHELDKPTPHVIYSQP